MSDELIARAIAFAEAQETMAANSVEDRKHWHHVAVATLLRELAAKLSAWQTGERVKNYE